MKNLNEKVKVKLENFFDWIKGAELVELKNLQYKRRPC